MRRHAAAFIPCVFALVGCQDPPKENASAATASAETPAPAPEAPPPVDPLPIVGVNTDRVFKVCHPGEHHGHEGGEATHAADKSEIKFQRNGATVNMDVTDSFGTTVQVVMRPSGKGLRGEADFLHQDGAEQKTVHKAVYAVVNPTTAYDQTKCNQDPSRVVRLKFCLVDPDDQSENCGDGFGVDFGHAHGDD